MYIYTKNVYICCRSWSHIVLRHYCLYVILPVCYLEFVSAYAREQKLQLSTDQFLMLHAYIISLTMHGCTNCTHCVIKLHDCLAYFN